MTQLVLTAFLLLTPILATLYLRRFIQENPAATAEELERAYTRTLLANAACLGGGLLWPQSHHRASVVLASFALCLFSFAWSQLDYTRALELVRARSQLDTPEKISARETLAQQLRTFGFIFSLVALLHFFHLFGLLIFVYAAPMFIRILFATEPMSPSELRDRITEVFEQAGTPVGQVRIIQSRRKNRANAMVCGTKWGIGPFRRTLLVTESLFTRLSEDELLAVMRHEAAHFRLNHIAKRLWAGLLGQVASLFLAGVPVFAFFSLLTWGRVASVAANTIAAGAFALLTFYWMNRYVYAVVHQQEHEADVESVRLGSSPDAMISALEKLTGDRGTHVRTKAFWRRLLLSQAHPSLEERIEVIRGREIHRASLLPQHPWGFAGAYALLLLMSVALSGIPRLSAPPAREIASETSRPANISH